MNFQFNNSIPGYAYFEEVKLICELVDEHPSKNILDAGCFMGKLSHSLYTTFPDRTITAIDIWGGDGNKYIKNDVRMNVYPNLENTFECFSLWHAASDLNAVNVNFMDYTESSEITILSLDAKNVVWEDAYRHALTITSGLVIGRHAHHHRNDILGALSKFEYTLYDHGVFVLNKQATK